MSQFQSFESSMGPGPGPIFSLTGDDAIVVSPNGAGNINILSDTGSPLGIGQPNSYIFGSVVAQGGLGTNHTLLIEPLTLTVQTIDATPTTIYLLSIPSNKAVVVRATIIGLRSDNLFCAGGDVIGIGRNPGGAGAFVTTGGSGLVSDWGGAFPPQAYADALTTHITIEVVGRVAETWNWTCNIQYQFETL
jgi:hypothetical protein